MTTCAPLSHTGKVKQEPTMYREGPPYQRRGSLQLWQFLVTLLDDPANAHFIAWTGRGMEFKLIEPEEVSLCYFSVAMRRHGDQGNLQQHVGFYSSREVRACHGEEAGQQASGMVAGEGSWELTAQALNKAENTQ